MIGLVRNHQPFLHRGEVNMKFIQRSNHYATKEKQVAAPYFRRNFFVKSQVKKARLCVTGLGFYEVYVNGKNITKGFLAPYRSNLNHYVYYDQYEIAEELVIGTNVIACVVGNGWQNAIGGYIWDFDRASWRGACKVAFELIVIYEDGTEDNIESDALTKTADSPIIFNDLHYGEYYDARREIPGWNLPDYDDSNWDFAEEAPTPAGELKICEAEPIVAAGEMKPVSVTAYEDGFIYDFGVNHAGLCRLKIRGEEGQKILLQHFEAIIGGKPYFKNFRYYPEQRFQEDEYICSGKGVETYMPHFTYHGFRYVYVTGITKEQATEELLTYVMLHSDISTRGYFHCDNEVINKIQEATVRSDISNFHYFPTDCPQREKNGWTADASLSAEQLLLNLTPEVSFREWMRNIYKALDQEGQLPGIVPTGGWGYLVPNGLPWNGPAWDSVIVNLPYYTYVYRGDKEILEEAAIPIMRYVTYLYSKINERDLFEFGLGDWCQPNRKSEGDHATPLVVTDSIVTADNLWKAMEIYDALGMLEQKAYVGALYTRLRTAIRKELIDMETASVFGGTQTGQAIAIAYRMFEEEEIPKAVEELVRRIQEKDNFMDTGVIGARVIFRVLAEYGYADLALHMISRPEHPSYGNIIARGATTLWEGFWKDNTCKILSMNHHFWGDVSAWFYTYLAGMRINPTGKNVQEVLISPCFVKEVNAVEALHKLPNGHVHVKWERNEGKIILQVSAPECVKVRINLPRDSKEEIITILEEK